MNNIIIFDGECNFCNFCVRFVIKHDINKNFLFASSNSKYAKEKLKTLNIPNISDKSLVLLKSNKYYIKSDAILEILRDLKYLHKFSILISFLPTPFINFIYDIIANYRKKIFHKNICKISDIEIKKRFLE